jgi:hypothetical protein
LISFNIGRFLCIELMGNRNHVWIINSCKTILLEGEGKFFKIEPNF